MFVEDLNFYLKIYNKLQNSLTIANIKKKELAKELGISTTALSKQLKTLRDGSGINIKTLRAVEKLTKINFFL